MNQYRIEILLPNIIKIINKYFDIYKKLISKTSNTVDFLQDPLQLNALLVKFFSNIVQSPDLMLKYQISFFKGQFETIESVLNSIFPDIKDKRFQDKTWQEHTVFAWIKEAYFTYTKWIDSMINDLPEDNFSKLELKKINFIIKQFLDAIAPSNFPHTNPEVLKSFFDSYGENFINGLDNLLQDIENSKSGINIRNTDNSFFEVGKNIATTEGYVVFQNKLIQLIHYKPLTQTQYEVPLLTIPPFINKYYILDLQSSNSFVKWLLEQNHNVFLISWVNPDEALSDQSFEDYILNGPIAALNYLSEVLKIKHVNAVGYCIGGTLLAATIAYLKKLKDDRIKTASFFTTLIDFENAGDISMFIDDNFVSTAKKYIDGNFGYVDGKDMSLVFNMLRSNEMIWPFYINNYLLGKNTFPFDILFWNEDSVRLPGDLYLFCIKNFYKDNLLTKENAIRINNIPISIKNIDIPCFSIAAKKDHIVPCSNVFSSSQLLCNVTYVLADSGHVAGIINHPDKNKYCFWVNDKKIQKFNSHDEWLETANETQGSWWGFWGNWIKDFSGQLVDWANITSIHPQIIEKAPGSYVKIRC